MEVKAKIKYQRIAPRKARLVADLIRRKTVFDAKRDLVFCKKRAAIFIRKLLESAIANAKNNFNLSEDKIENMIIKEIKVDEGPKLKRWRPVARGTAHQIEKKTSHITLVLGEIKKEDEKKEQEEILKKEDKKIKEKNKKAKKEK